MFMTIYIYKCPYIGHIPNKFYISGNSFMVILYFNMIVELALHVHMIH